MRFDDFYEAFNFLRNHRMCECEINLGGNGRKRKCMINYFDKCLDISVVKVNPKTNEIDTKMDNNTKTEVWLEFGRAFIDYSITDNVMFEHDYRLDCGADTFEKAIVKLANLVNEFYFDNGEEKHKITEL